MPSLFQWFSVLCAVSLASSVPNPLLKQADAVSQPSAGVAGLQTPVDPTASPVAKPSTSTDVTSLAQLSQQRIRDIVDEMTAVDQRWPSMTKFPQRNDDPGYTVVREIGRGGSGTVLLANQESTGNQVALKCFNSDPSYREVVARELRMMMLIDTIGSSYFPRQLDHFMTDQLKLPEDTERNMKVSNEHLELVCIAMDYFEGREYLDVLTEKNQPINVRISKMLKYILEALSAVELLHHFGIVHGDLHASNIFITSDDRVKLIDFGLARQLPIDFDENNQLYLQIPGYSYLLRRDLENLFDLTFLEQLFFIINDPDETMAQVQTWLASHPEKQAVVDTLQKKIDQKKLDVATLRSALEAILAP